jgi:hypothetical protein
MRKARFGDFRKDYSGELQDGEEGTIGEVKEGVIRS